MPGWIPLAFLGMLHLDGAKAEHLPWLIVRYKIWSSIVLVYAPWAGPLGGCIPRQIARNYSNLIAGICQKKSTCQADDTCTGNSNSSFAVNRCLIHGLIRFYAVVSSLRGGRNDTSRWSAENRYPRSLNSLL